MVTMVRHRNFPDDRRRRLKWRRTLAGTPCSEDPVTALRRRAMRPMLAGMRARAGHRYRDRRDLLLPSVWTLRNGLAAHDAACIAQAETLDGSTPRKAHR